MFTGRVSLEASLSAVQLPIHRDPEIMGGAVVFVGTRVPAQTLLDYLEGGESIDTFLEHFLSVTRDQAVAMLDAGTALLIAQTAHAA